jgi:hypothetical protein
MSLSDLEIKQEYCSYHNDIVGDFYILILQQSSSYKRAVGF